MSNKKNYCMINMIDKVNSIKSIDSKVSQYMK